MKKLYHYPAMLTLSIISAVVLIIFEIFAYISCVIFDKQIYSEAMGKYQIGDIIYEQLDEYFGQYSAPTGIPKECFTNSLDKSELSSAAFALLTDSLDYLTSPDAQKPEVKYDFTQLEEDVTNYIEEYSEENGIEKDDEYYSLIDNTIETAEAKISSTLDCMMLHTLAKTDFATNLHKYAGYVNTGMAVSGILLAILVVIMIIVDRRHMRDLTYWLGSVLFVSSLTILIPALYLKKTDFFGSFIISTEHIYKAITGLLKTCLNQVINAEIFMLIIGVVLIILTIFIHFLYLKYLKRKDRDMD